MSFHDVHVENLRLPQVFDACLEHLALSRNINRFDFTSSLSNPGLGLLTLTDSNAEQLEYLLKKGKLSHVRALDLTHNQFGASRW